MTNSRLAALIGRQQPRISNLPRAESSAGREAVDLYNGAQQSTSKHLLPWQCSVLDGMLAERADHRWAAREAALVVARQNGKSEVIIARELFGLFILGERIVHTAHLYDTAQESFERIERLIRHTPHLHRRVKPNGYRHANGEQQIELCSGARLEFMARSPKSGRGLSGDVTVLDEAMDIPEWVMSALVPTMSTAANMQLIYAATAVDQGNPAHANGATLARVRRRALTGSDPSLAYWEWSVDEDAYRADPEAVAADRAAQAAANPSLGALITEEYVDWEMSTLTARSFAVERLSVGDWPSEDVVVETVIDPARWRVLARPGATRPSGRVALGVAVSKDRAWASIGAAGMVGDRVQLELAENRRGTAWVVNRLAELVAKHSATIVVDSGGPAGALLPAMRDRSIPFVSPTGREIAAACGGLYDVVHSDPPGLIHLGQPALDVAVGGARRRKYGDGAWAWDLERSPVDIAPLVAVTLALHGLSSVPARSPAPAPLVEVVPGSSETFDLLSMDF